mgnify:CR=1 FL=1
MGRDPWEFKWELLGSDVLYETVRFPKTRPKMILNLDGKGFTEKPTDSLKMMGENFGHYRPDGGVDCWVLKATADPEWVPDGYAGSTVARFEQGIWSNFWRIATSPEESRSRGIRVAQGEAVYSPMKPGDVYELNVDALGGMTLTPQERIIAASQE